MAQTYTWQMGYNGYWTDPNAWQEGTVPQTGDASWVYAGNVAANGVNTSQGALTLSQTTSASVGFTDRGGVLGSVNTYAVGSGVSIDISNTEITGFFQDHLGQLTVYVAPGTSATSLQGLNVLTTNAPSTTDVYAYGPFGNGGDMGASGGGTLNIHIGPGSYVENGGIIGTAGGGVVNLLGGQVLDGTLDANGGTVVVDSVVHQNGGISTIENNGALADYDIMDSGTVQISSGTLQLGSPTTMEFFHDPIQFTGATGSIAVVGAVSLGEVLDPVHNTLTVSATTAADPTPQTYATFQLVGGSYDPRMFHVQQNTYGSEIDFHRSIVST